MSAVDSPELSARSFTDVVSDLEAHRARELSLSLQNDRLRSLVRQTSLDKYPISPRKNADCDVRITSIGNAYQVSPRAFLSSRRTRFHDLAC